MGKKHIFQPDRLGRRATDNNPGKSLARSHNMAADVPARHGGKPNIARDASRGAHTYDLKVHGGMQRVSKTGAVTLGGDHASALDALSGLTVVPGKDGRAATAHPLTTPPKPKNLQTRVQPHPSMRSRSRLDADTAHELGRRMLAEATSSPDDRQALAHYGIGKQ